MAISAGLLLLVAATLLLLRYQRQVLLWLRRRLHQYECLARIDGPHSIPLLGTAYLFKWGRLGWRTCWGQQFARQLLDWSLQYGAEGLFKVWIGPKPGAVILSAEAAEVVLNSSIEINKSDDYDILVPWLGYGLLISGGEKWRSRRKMLTPTFHYSILDGFVDVYNRQADTFVKVLADGVADSGKTVDMFPYVKRCALDIICETAMGVTVNAQLNAGSEYVMAVQDINEIAFRYQRSPWLWAPPLFYAFGYGFRYNACLRTLKGFSGKVIAERSEQLRQEARRQQKQLSQLNTDGQKTAFLDLLLMMSDDNRLTNEDIIDEVETFMFEGHDTTSSGMSWCLWFLSHHRDCQERVYQELREVLGDDPDVAIRPEQLKELRYLERCLKEALRLCPPVPIFARTLVNDVVSAGKTLPAGADVLIVAMSIQRDPHYYDNPDDFDPDNFLPERVAKRHAYAFVPFSAGSRNCIGQKFAMMEEKTVVAKVLLNYWIEPMDTMDNVIPMPEIITRPLDGFPVRFHSRNK